MSRLYGCIFPFFVLPWCYFPPPLSFCFLFQWPRMDALHAHLARVIIKTVLYSIWKFQNKATFHNGTEDSPAIIRYINIDIRKRIAIDHFYLAQFNFVSAWESCLLYKNIVAELYPLEISLCQFCLSNRCSSFITVVSFQLSVSFLSPYTG